MQTLRRNFSTVPLKTLITLLATVISLPLGAQTWPAKPLRIVVPYAAGGSATLVTRLIGNKLSENIGQSVIIDKRGGIPKLVIAESSGTAAFDRAAVAGRAGVSDDDAVLRGMDLAQALQLDLDGHGWLISCCVGGSGDRPRGARAPAGSC